MLKKFKLVGALSLSMLTCSTGIALASDPSASNTLETQSVQQEGAGKGVVKDGLGDPIIGATVVVKGQPQKGTVTGIDGDFTIADLKKGETITISYIGYEPVEVKYNGSPINVTLQEDSEMLNEAVVIGYGGVQKAKSMTASVTPVKMSTIAKLPVTSVAEGLGGRVTGVVTQQSSGAPGENTKIWIRGGKDILYVIDDVVMETAQGNEFFNRLRPDDIASMSILKDATATAVYGPRAKNGVVVISTKRGTEGTPTITFSQKLSIMTPAYKPKGMSSYEYAKTRNELAFANFEESPAYSNTEMSKFYMGDLWQKGYSKSDIYSMVQKEYPTVPYTQESVNDLFDPLKTVGGNIQDYYGTYDPWDMLNHTQPMYQTNLSIRGGSDRVKYYSSLGYLKQKGIGDRFDYEQVNFILNTDAYLLKDKSLKFTMNTNGNTSMNKKPAVGDGIFREIMFGSGMPNRPAEWSTGLVRKNSADAYLNTGFNNTEAYRFQINSALRWEVPWVEGLSATGSVNFNTSYSTNRQFNHDQEGVYDNPASTIASTYNPDNANLYQSWNKYKLLTGIFQLDYVKSIDKHNFAVMLNYQSQTRNTNWSASKRKGYPSTLAPQLELGATMVELESQYMGNTTEWGSASWIGRISYDYDGKYLLQYSGNYNGSLSYSPDKRWGYFQAISAGWVMTEESWFKNLVSPKIVNQIKLRGGYGIVGEEVGSPFSYLTQYGQNSTRVLFGDNMASNVGWRVTDVANNLKWSSSKQMSLGLDFDLFRNRLNGAFDTYLYLNSGSSMNMTEDMIRTDILGMPNVPKINAPFATSRKGGFEVALNWQDRIDQVGYRLGVNYSYWDERQTRHADTNSDYWSPTFDYIGERYMKDDNNNDPVYPYGIVTNGLNGSWQQMYNSMLHASKNQTLGTFALVDLNGDGRVNDYKTLNNAGTTPLTMYGITVGGDWKGFDLELFFQGAANVTGVMPSPMRSQQSYMWNYGQYAFQNAYTPSNPDLNAALPIPSPEGSGWGYNSVDWWAFDASYFKLKNISLRYDLKRSLLKNINYIDAIELSFVVSNVYTWTKKSYPLKGLNDPEFLTSGASIYSSNGTLGSYPIQRSYTFGITVTL